MGRGKGEDHSSHRQNLTLSERQGKCRNVGEGKIIYKERTNLHPCVTDDVYNLTENKRPRKNDRCLLRLDPTMDRLGWNRTGTVTSRLLRDPLGS